MLNSKGQIERLFFQPLCLVSVIFIIGFRTLLFLGDNNDLVRLDDLSKQSNPDAVQYVQLANNLWDKGIYSRHPEAAGEPDVLRTPAYPLFIIVVGALRSPVNLYLAQAVLVVAMILLIYRLGERVQNRRCGIIAALFLATDVLILTSCFEAMSELLFLFFTLLSLDILRWPTGIAKTCTCKSRAFTGGLVLGISTLARPSNLYLPIILFACELLSAIRERRIFSYCQTHLVTLIAFSIIVSPWIARNYYVAGIPKLTTVDKHNLVYFVGAGALQAKHGWSRQTAQEFIKEKYSLPSYAVLQNPWGDPTCTTKELYDSVSSKALDVALAEPPMLLKSSIIGVAKSSIAHSAIPISEITGGKWSSLSDYNGNSWYLYVVFLFQTLHTALSILMCISTVFFGFWNKQAKDRLLPVVIILLYYYLIVAMFGFDAVARARICCLPFIFALAGISLEKYWSSRPKPLQIS